jgi:hypothetical protein
MVKKGIYTYLRGDEAPAFVAKTWHEVIALEWVFAGLQDGKAIMTRNGYINVFFELDGTETEGAAVSP